jgi:hypothetical protein
MRIFFTNYPRPHYGLDTVHDGLCKLIGEDNVIDFPQKRFLHGETISDISFFCHPGYFNFKKRPAGDLQTFKTLNEKGCYDLLIISCEHDTHFGTDHLNSEVMSYLRLIHGHIPTIILDQGDSPVINETVIAMFPGAMHYLKREVPPGQPSTHRYDMDIVPFTFSYSEDFAIKGFDENKEIHNRIFWAGNRLNGRGPYLSRLEDLLNTGFKTDYQQEQYRNALRNSLIGLNLAGKGFDTVRYYEIPANGVMLFSQRPAIEIPMAFEHEKSCVYFDDIDDMSDKLEFYLKNEDLCIQIAKSGYEHYKKYHTTKIRAGQMIEPLMKPRSPL